MTASTTPVKTCPCGEFLPHACPVTYTGPGYPGPDPAGPPAPLTVPASWLIDLTGRDQ